MKTVTKTECGEYSKYPKLAIEQLSLGKTLTNSTMNHAKDQIDDFQVVGNNDMFQLLCKASSESEGWMKSTKAMEIPGVGGLVQVTTQQWGNVAEALQFVPGVIIVDDDDGGRRLTRDSSGDPTSEDHA